MNDNGKESFSLDLSMKTRPTLQQGACVGGSVHLFYNYAFANVWEQLKDVDFTEAQGYGYKCDVFVGGAHEKYELSSATCIFLVGVCGDCEFNKYFLYKDGVNQKFYTSSISYKYGLTLIMHMLYTNVLLSPCIKILMLYSYIREYVFMKSASEVYLREVGCPGLSMNLEFPVSWTVSRGLTCSCNVFLATSSLKFVLDVARGSPKEQSSLIHADHFEVKERFLYQFGMLLSISGKYW